MILKYKIKQKDTFKIQIIFKYNDTLPINYNFEVYIL